MQRWYWECAIKLNFTISSAGFLTCPQLKKKTFMLCFWWDWSLKNVFRMSCQVKDIHTEELSINYLSLGPTTGGMSVQEPSFFRPNMNFFSIPRILLRNHKQSFIFHELWSWPRAKLFSCFVIAPVEVLWSWEDISRSHVRIVLVYGTWRSGVHCPGSNAALVGACLPPRLSGNCGGREAASSPGKCAGCRKGQKGKHRGSVPTKERQIWWKTSMISPGGWQEGYPGSDQASCSIFLM